jgi:hypothetical protein
VSDHTTIAVPWIKDEDSGYNDPGFDVNFYAVRDVDGQWRALVRDSGCVDLRRTFQPEGNSIDYTDSLHICDIDDLIERLQALKILAAQHFGEWPE